MIQKYLVKGKKIQGDFRKGNPSCDVSPQTVLALFWPKTCT